VDEYPYNRPIERMMRINIIIRQISILPSCTYSLRYTRKEKYVVDIFGIPKLNFLRISWWPIREPDVADVFVNLISIGINRIGGRG
jgi:hypothetical protein